MNTVRKVLALVFSVTMLFACGGGEEMTVDVEKAKVAIEAKKGLSVASDAVMNVQLPFADGVAKECYQNSHDTPTHSGDSTMSDLDFAMNVGTIVVAASDGIVTRYPEENKNGGFGWYIKVDHGNNYWTIYAHLSGFIAESGQRVVAGQPIAYSGGKSGASGSGTSTGAHLHFGVHSGSNLGLSKRMAVYALDRDTGSLGYFVTGDRQASSGFACAVFTADGKTKISNGHFYESRPIGTALSNYQCRSLANSAGVLCWSGTPTTCEDGKQHAWYHKNSEGAYFSESDSNTWQKCSQTTGSTNIFAYLDGGYGVGGVGPGTEIIPDIPPAQEPPDFITKRSWLETPWGVETYKYGRAETVKMKGQFKNEGSGPCKSGESPTIIVHAYLSNGYKEDAHTEWKRVGTDEIQCANMQPGDTHTETEGIELWRDVPGPGIYNIVWCIDHPKDDHNNGGQHLEKHESNNCSTEAVFEVVEGTVNVPNVDLTSSGFTILQTPLYAGDYIRLGAWVKNQGTVNATNDIRSSYTVSCNGGPTTMLTDDGTMASTLVAGASAWEETLAPVLMPNVVGTCALSFAVDYQGNQTETDETNNIQTLTVTLAPRPAPILSITRFEDKVGCCTTNTGAAPQATYLDPK